MGNGKNSYSTALRHDLGDQNEIQASAPDGSA
jgi:hypothetical protein